MTIMTATQSNSTIRPNDMVAFILELIASKRVEAFVNIQSRATNAAVRGIIHAVRFYPANAKPPLIENLHWLLPSFNEEVFMDAFTYGHWRESDVFKFSRIITRLKNSPDEAYIAFKKAYTATSFVSHDNIISHAYEPLLGLTMLSRENTDALASVEKLTDRLIPYCRVNASLLAKLESAIQKSFTYEFLYINDPLAYAEMLHRSLTPVKSLLSNDFKTALIKHTLSAISTSLSRKAFDASRFENVLSMIQKTPEGIPFLLTLITERPVDNLPIESLNLAIDKLLSFNKKRLLRTENPLIRTLQDRNVHQTSRIDEYEYTAFLNTFLSWQAIERCYSTLFGAPFIEFDEMDILCNKNYTMSDLSYLVRQPLSTALSSDIPHNKTTLKILGYFHPYTALLTTARAQRNKHAERLLLSI